MKKKTTGKQFTKRETIEFSHHDELRAHLEQNGKLQSDGSIKFGASFQDRIEALKEFATKVLASEGLPAAPILYQISKPVYIDSTDAQDIARAKDLARIHEIINKKSQTSTNPKIIKGKKLHSDFKEKWVAEKPKPKLIYGFKYLTKFIEDKGFAKDSDEDLAARIILEIHHLTYATKETQKLDHAMTLGQLFLTAKVYGLQSFQARKNAKDKIRHPWARQLAEALRNQTNSFKRAWNLIPVGSVNGPYFSDDIKAYVDNTGTEEVLRYEADDGTNPELKKESFRTGYFVKKK